MGLAGEVKNWNDVNFPVDNYFEHVQDHNLQGNALYNTMISTLNNLSGLKLVDGHKMQHSKNGADRLLLCNNKAIKIPQVKLFMDYCRNIKVYLSSPAIKSVFLFQYAKVRESKRKEGERNRRLEEEAEEKSKMLHDGKMIAYQRRGQWNTINRKMRSKTRTKNSVVESSIDELSPIKEEDIFDMAYISSNLPLVERLNMSGIAFIDSTNSNCFLPGAIENDVTNMINKFTRAIEYDTEDMLLFPTKIVVGIFFNNRKDSIVCQFNYRYYQAPEHVKNTEDDFKSKYVVPFINAAFNVNDKLVVYWDKPLNIYSNSNMKLQRRQTTDANFTAIDGMEIGYDIEYFVHEYNPDESTATSRGEVDNEPYVIVLLESLFHYKKMMDTSIADVADVEKPYVYSDAHKRFEPTVTLLKLGDE
ncbi:hypothetical protein INT47_010387 [Mucor saturninus]|uniref:Uncharacterized protein n=1 Tax=Mucor saturninus TaxID=64648 RepID=A0A8H7QPR6_9FUNG|nr:hypothetical protein INT47_010387 [Mucor saturninus]